MVPAVDVATVHRVCSWVRDGLRVVLVADTQRQEAVYFFIVIHL